MVTEEVFLNTLELAVKSTPERKVTVEIMEECLQQKIKLR